MKNHPTLYQSVFAQARDAIFIIDPEHGRIMEANLAAERMLAYSRDEFLSMRVFDLYVSDKHELQAFFSEVMRRGHGVNDDLKCLKKSGELIDAAITASGIDVDGAQWLMCSLSDSSERKAAEERAKVEAEKFRVVFEHAFDSILVLQHGRVKMANAAAGKIWGGSAQEIVGKSLLDSVHIDDHALVSYNYEARLSGKGGEKPYELRIMRKDGTPVWTESVGNKIEFDGEPADLVLIRDISERKRLEAEIERRERQLSVLAEAGRLINQELTEAGVCRALVDCGRRLVDANAGGAGLYRDGNMVFNEFLRGDTFVPIDLVFEPGQGVPGHVLQTFQPYLSNDAMHDTHVIPEIQQALAFDKLLDVPILNTQGDLLGCFEICDPADGRDFDAQDTEMMQSLAAIASGALENARLIDELTATGASLKVSETRFRDLVEVMPNGMVVLLDGKVVFANPAALTMFGYTADEAIGQSLMQRIHPDYRATAAARVQKLLGEQRGINQIEEEIMLRRDGTPFDVEVTSSYTEFDGQPAVLAVLRDISQRVMVERALLQSAETIRAVARHTTGVVFQFAVRDSGEWYFPYVSDAVERYLGVCAEDAMADAQRVFARAHPEDAELLQLTIQEAVAAQTAFVWQGRFRGANDEVIWFSCSSEPQYIDDGSIVWNGVAVDETRQHQLQAQLLQAQKMEAVGTLVGGIAHDFNNMLAGMLGHLYLMKINLQQDEIDIGKVVERIDAVDRQGRLAAEVINQLLTFARKGSVCMQRVELNRLVTDVMHLHRVSIPENIRMETHLDDILLPVRGDVGLIQQMLLNLLTNARDALDDCVQPHISITLAQFKPDAAYLAQHSEFEDRPYACIAVCDNGCGMNAAVLNKIFDPFFTTKEIGRGSGLGLSMTYGGMQTHGGHILVESEPHQGACFRLCFPLLREEMIAEQMQGESIRGSGQCILLADDQPNVLDVMQQALESLDYKVLIAGDGEQAVQVFSRHAGKIELAILDVVMPEKGGVEVAEILREANPDLPVIFHTGYGEEAKLEAVQAWSRCTTVKKPTSIEALSRCIASLLA